MQSATPFLEKPLLEIGKRDKRIMHCLFSLRLQDLWQGQPSKFLSNPKKSSERYQKFRIKDQKYYYTKQHDNALPWANLLTRTYRLTLIAVFLISSTYLCITLLKQADNPPEQLASTQPQKKDKGTGKLSTFYLLPVGLAGLGLFSMAAISVHELGRRTQRFKLAAQELDRQNIRLTESTNASESIQVMTETELYLIDEVYSWKNYSLFVNKH